MFTLHSPRRTALYALALLLLLPAASRAAIIVTNFTFGTETPVISTSTIEDFEDVTLQSGLSIRLAGTTIGAPKTWSGALPRMFDPATASGVSPLGGPFSKNTWDGTYAMTNGGWGTGVTGIHNGNFWDFNFADTVSFSFSTPMTQVGVGLSNFQSPGFPAAVTNHSIIVNGQVWGLCESLPGWVGGSNVRNGYVVVAATAPDVINSVSFALVSATDGLVFDELSFTNTAPPPLPTKPTTWGRLKTLFR